MTSYDGARPTYDVTQFRTQYNITQIAIYKLASVGASLSLLQARDPYETGKNYPGPLYIPVRLANCDIDFEQKVPFHSYD